MNRVMHFEFGAEDPKRLKEFFENVFGWKIERWGDEDYWLIKTGERGTPGIDGGIFKREEGAVTSSTYDEAVNSVVTAMVLDVDHAAQMVEENGGEIVKQKQEIEKMGWLVYARDTEGNIFGMMEAMPGMMNDMDDMTQTKIEDDM